jgi:hypothetical protein
VKILIDTSAGADPQVLGYGIETTWVDKEAPPRGRTKQPRAGR